MQGLPKFVKTCKFCTNMSNPASSAQSCWNLQFLLEIVRNYISCTKMPNLASPAQTCVTYTNLSPNLPKIENFDTNLSKLAWLTPTCRNLQILHKHVRSCKSCPNLPKLAKFPKICLILQGLHKYVKICKSCTNLSKLVISA